jgi:hypothetical protein
MQFVLVMLIQVHHCSCHKFNVPIVVRKTSIFLTVHVCTYVLKFTFLSSISLLPQSDLSNHLPALACLLTSWWMQLEHLIIGHSCNFQFVHISIHSIKMEFPDCPLVFNCLIRIPAQPVPHYRALCQCLYHITGPYVNACTTLPGLMSMPVPHYRALCQCLYHITRPYVNACTTLPGLMSMPVPHYWALCQCLYYITGPYVNVCTTLLGLMSMPVPHYWALCQCLYHITGTLSSASILWLYTLVSSSLCWQSVLALCVDSLCSIQNYYWVVLSYRVLDYTHN